MFYFFVLLVSLAFAQVGDYSALAVSRPRLGEVINAGDSFELKWKPSAAIPVVDLVLKTGGPSNLVTSGVIAQKVSNTGSYIWNVPKTMSTNTALSLMICDSRDPSISNFSPYFTVLEVGRGYTELRNSPSMAIGAINEARPTKNIEVRIKEHRTSHWKDDTTVSAKSVSALVSPVLGSSSRILSQPRSTRGGGSSQSSIASDTRARILVEKAKFTSGCAKLGYPSLIALVALLFLQ